MFLFAANGIKYVRLGFTYNQLLRDKGLQAMPNPREDPELLDFLRYGNPLDVISWQKDNFLLSIRLLFAKYPYDSELEVVAHEARLRLFFSVLIAVGTLLSCILVVLIFGPTPS